MTFGFVIDNRNCIGCHACTVACKSEHEVPLGVNRTWVKYVEKGEYPQTKRLFSVMRCNHCSSAPCVEICPTTALFRREDGIVDFNSNRCIGCKGCMQACPYDALYIDPESHTAAKCNYCSHRVDIGLEPACVNVCPTHAIISGNLEDPHSEISQRLSHEKVQVRKPEKGTYPKLFYIHGDEVSLDPALSPKETQYLWSEQALGVGHFNQSSAEKAKVDPAFSTHSFLENLQKTAAGSHGKRVYDAPDKGVLWGWEVVAYILTKALASGFILIYFSLKILDPQSLSLALQNVIVWISLFFLGLTSFFLVIDLDKPSRFLYVILRPQWKSWLVRGAYILMGFGASLTAWSLCYWLGRLSFLPFFEISALVFAFLSAIYTAFLLGQAKGRDFWQNPLCVVHMLNHALLASASLSLIVFSFLPAFASWCPFFFKLTLGSLALQFCLLLAELFTVHATKDAQQTLELILKGPFKKQFWGGVFCVGHLLPFFLLLLGGTSSLFTLGAGLCIGIGLWFFQYIWIFAPQRIPLS